jgi:hypothetical protein
MPACGWPSALGVRPETRGKTRGWLHEVKGGLPAPLPAPQPTPDSAAQAHNKTQFVYGPSCQPPLVNHGLSTAAQVPTGLQVDGDQFASDSVIRTGSLNFRDSFSSLPEKSAFGRNPTVKVQWRTALIGVQWRAGAGRHPRKRRCLSS